MNHSTQTRQRALLLPLGLLMLSMAVFGWGLQYKLSLYRTLYQSKTAIAHGTPEAKLLSQKERPATVQGSSHISQPPVLPLLFLLAFAAVAFAAKWSRYSRAWHFGATWPPLPSCYRTIFVRPPPAFSCSL